jgi:hypothetical protein
MSKGKFILFLLFFSFFVSKAQLKFPNGPVLNLNTNINVLYFETEIRFYTGKYKVDKYNWEKVADSLDSRWLFSSCFNGDCWNDLPSNGTFVKEFGFNDTTGFIRFHVATYDSNGKSFIKYMVYNQLDIADQALLTFNITFEKEVGMKDKHHSLKINIFQNAANGKIRIQFDEPVQILITRILDIHGKIVFETTEKGDLTVSQLPKGLYVVELISADQMYSRKFVCH